MNMWLLAWVSLRYVRATWDSPADRLAKDNVGDHPFASSISEAASMRNQIAKHGGSAYQLTLVLAQRTVDQIANAHAKAVATLFIAMQDWLKWPSERKKRSVGWFEPTPAINVQNQVCSLASGNLFHCDPAVHLRSSQRKMDVAHVESSHWSLFEVLLLV